MYQASTVFPPPPWHVARLDSVFDSRLSQADVTVALDSSSLMLRKNLRWKIVGLRVICFELSLHEDCKGNLPIASISSIRISF